MASGQYVRAQFRGGGQQIAELDVAVTGHTRDRRFARYVAIGKLFDHTFGKAALVIKNVVGDFKLFSDPPGIMNVLAGAATARLGARFSVVI